MQNKYEGRTYEEALQKCLRTLELDETELYIDVKELEPSEDNKNKVETEVTYSQEKSGVAEVVFHFLEDGSSASVMMLQPYGEDGVWVPQTSENKTD